MKASTPAPRRPIAVTGNRTAIEVSLTLLRILVGWHFLYEGVSKLFSPWSSAGFLMESQGPLSGVFHWIAETPDVLRVVDMLNVAGAVLIGVSLSLGLLTRISATTGAILLLFYYLANPPFIGYSSEVTGEGHYLIVNKQLIEMAVLLVIAFLPRNLFWSIDRWIAGIWRKRDDEAETSQLAMAHSVRREMLKGLIALPFLGGFSWALAKKRKWDSYEELSLVSGKSRVDAISGATKMVQFAKLAELKGKVPTGRIKGYEISRVIFGGGIVSGYAHSRDLIYVSPLIQAYNNDEKVMDTFRLCEAVGINTMILRVDNNTLKILKKYRKRGGALQWIAQCRITEDTINPDIDAAIENGAMGIYIQGMDCDKLVRENKIDVLSRAIEYIRKQDQNDQLICGFAAHDLRVVVECEKHGLDLDFYMKTFNSANYWTAGPRLVNDPNWRPDPTGNTIIPEYAGDIIGADYHDNMWCNSPEQTKEFMKKVQKPWVAFKVLGAGAIHPSQGFKYAFGNGADFACVGMFDFQIVENANLACEALSEAAQRQRPWMA